MFLVAKAAHEW